MIDIYIIICIFCSSSAKIVFNFLLANPVNIQKEFSHPKKNRKKEKSNIYPRLNEYEMVCF